jgi:lipopolysaccharide biosynthesis glycosyltransferase
MIVINFIYCLDENYNTQCITSIFSILEKTSEKANFFILHENPASINKLLQRVEGHKMTNDIVTQKFDKDSSFFINLEKSHVSAASYFRLYLDEYFDGGLKYFVYIDPDVICNLDPVFAIRDSIKKMSQKSLNVGAVTEDVDEVKSSNSARLKLPSQKYFNAGIMIINLATWKSETIGIKLREILKNSKDKIVLHDQDVLNLFFDGDYLELSPYLNFTVPILNDDVSKKLNKFEIGEVIFYHFAGNRKPWQLKGLFNPLAEVYQNTYRNLFNKKYHFDNMSKRKTLRILLETISSRRFLEFKFPLHYIYFMIKFLISK